MKNKKLLIIIIIITITSYAQSVSDQRMAEIEELLRKSKEEGSKSMIQLKWNKTMEEASQTKEESSKTNEEPSKTSEEPSKTSEEPRETSAKVPGISEVTNCVINQETNDLFGVPMYHLVCSRLRFFKNPSQNELPELLSHLDLSHNRFEHLNSSFRLESSSLQFLDYSYNQIRNISTDFFEHLTNLVNLNLGNNNLSHLHTFLNLRKLKTLNLASNHIHFIPKDFFDGLGSLEDLNLSQNNLGSFFFQVDFQIFPQSLTILNLDAVNLRNFTPEPFENLHNLKVFSLADNPLEIMPKLPFRSLQSLDISGLNISKISERHLNFSLLAELKMSRLSRLNSIGDLAFANLPNLETLVVENCERLGVFNSLSFGFLNRDTVKDFKLRRISLARNNISTLNGAYEYLFRGLEEVYLEENPWNCGCELTWMTHLKNVKNVQDFRCYEPPQLRYKIISGLKPQEFVCFENRNLGVVSVTTHHWLFPLIGALSICVIILVGVLIYLGPFTNQIQWTRSIGPDSPYNRITIEPYEETSRHL